MADKFNLHNTGLSSPAGNAAAVTPSDSTDLEVSGRALWVGGTGDVALVTVGGNTVTLANVPGGTMLPVRTARVLATGTTATSIIALW